MTRIKVFKIPRAFSVFYLILGAVTLLVGTVLMIKAFINGFNTHFPSGDWNSVIFTVQGGLFVLVGSSFLVNRKYFIEWDENELRFLLPDTKKIETIRFVDIVSVNIKLFEIQLNLIDRTRIIDLNNLQFEDLRKIKERFESIITHK